MPKSSCETTFKSCKETIKTIERCAVCGDLATGFHYEVASCNGCKTFFRRTLVSNRTYKCHKNGNCTFDKDMRCACRACRFDKCVAVGMNPKAIQCNRTGRLSSPQEAQTSSTSSYASFESEIPQQRVSTSNSMENELTCLLPASVTATIADDMKRKRSSASSDSESVSKRAYTISALLDFPKSESDSMSKNSRLRCSNGTTTPSSIPTNITASIGDKIRKHCLISEKHEQLISHLIRAQEIINEVLDPEKCDTSISILDLLTRPSIALATSPIITVDDKQPKQHNSSPETVLNQKLEVAVEYAKTFESFQWMPVQDKILLLRDVVFVLILLETAYKISISKSNAVLNHRNQKETRSVEENIGMAMIIESFNRAKLDKKEFLLLKAIAFMHSENFSECSGLSPTSFRQLSCQRQLILDTLFNYMMCKHDKHGPVRFGHALSVLWSVYEATNSYVESLMDMDLKPLTAELLANKLPEFLT